ncbi:hypothetical protein HOK31_03375, partial [Candidatus Poribacteria bacterium]|nr:hypothetical protein [Candidatus Poribacteria bacterium]
PLIEACLSSADPAAALERLCREHPDLADDLRAHTEVFDRPTATQAGPTDTFCPLGAEPAWGKMSIAYGQAADYLKALLEAQISPASG